MSQDVAQLGSINSDCKHCNIYNPETSNFTCDGGGGGGSCSKMGRFETDLTLLVLNSISKYYLTATNLARSYHTHSSVMRREDVTDFPHGASKLCVNFINILSFITTNESFKTIKSESV